MAERNSFSIALSNAQADPLNVWVEPWAEDYVLEKRGQLELLVSAQEVQPGVPLIEIDRGTLVVWAAGGTRIEVTINGASQYSASSQLDCPGSGDLGTKGMIGALFGGRS